MKIFAATLIKKNLVKVLKLNFPKLKRGQVLVKIKYSSICHTQLQEIQGLRGKDRFLPHCLGHEATGVTLSCGPGVKKVKKNDKICISWLSSKGINSGGTFYNFNKKKINAGPVNTFSNLAIISENKIIKLPKNANLKKSVLFGCAIPTAFNAVFNTLKESNKDNIIIFGAGGLGLACIFAAKKAGYKKIFAVDKILNKLKMAKKFGATNIIHVRSGKENKLITKSKKFFKNAIECTGSLKVMKIALNSVENFGGKVIIIGNYPVNKTLSVNPWNFIMGKSVSGAWLEKFNYDLYFKKFYKFAERFPWKEYFDSKSYKLENIDLALKDFKNGKVIRPLIEMY